MATSTRLKGKSGLVFSMKKGAAAAVSFDDVKSFELTNEDKDDSDLTFAEAAAGTGIDWTLSITGITSFDSGSLFSYLWDNVGSDVVVTVGPWGNASPSATKPHFTGTATIRRPPGIANEARQTEEGAEFEYELSYSTALTKVTA